LEGSSNPKIKTHEQGLKRAGSKSQNTVVLVAIQKKTEEIK
jgi:hypothetical protein